MKCSQCGGDRADCSDPEKMWYPQRAICHLTRERMAAERRYAELHKDRPYHDGTERSWAKEASRTHPYHFNDGVHVWVAVEDVNPDDQFLSDVSKRVSDKERGEGG